MSDKAETTRMATEMIEQKTDIWHKHVGEGKHLDIILMDWEMPTMEGLTCCREIREMQKEGKLNRHVQIIATTANARDEQIELALAGSIVNSFPNIQQYPAKSRLRTM